MSGHHTEPPWWLWLLAFTPMLVCSAVVVAGFVLAVLYG